ncbi:hypothetical protein MHZ96_10275 [Bacillus safensis]|uniref:hypothetical protein n=1 Tax=Bacillus TaxID=1386 RepID=UPI0007387D97|nr:MULTISPECIES: hypothetical protein [Bacillus]KUF25365.1 hypothetical protein AMR95_06190 [Bacillus sp. G1(2015b)]KUR60794.1 hypothetical protein AOQ70_05170 [Bacillus sp. AM 13(2015)]MCY7733976.1 hypothetical protein [Bacillus safensis]MEC1113433.1 hypothetical protein [Bacillus safensis]
MKDSNSQIFVILLAISLIIGCFIPGFLENSNLVLAVTVSALAFILVDLSNFLKLNRVHSILPLFVAVFSISVLPHTDYLNKLLQPLNNFFTVYGLAIVIGILGAKQYLEEHAFLKKNKKNLEDRENEYNELIDILEDYKKEIKDLKEIIKEERNKNN